MVERWDVITIGNLSRNRYWGEDEARPVRATLCTTTLITGTGFRLLVDPSCEDADRMAAELNRRTGLQPAAVDAVFVTHAHGDHHAGLRHFPSASWLAAPGVAAAINASNAYPKAVEPVSGFSAGRPRCGSPVPGATVNPARREDPAPTRLFEAIDVIPTPGHTLDHHSLTFVCDGLTVAITGDAVMTKDFWRDRRGFFNSVDLALSTETMNRLAAIADIIVPGHDNAFLISPR